MSVIFPTVTAYTVDEYHEQMNTAASFASGVHIDLGDGVFTKKTVGIADVWWPESVQADVHLMYEKPGEHIEELIALHPRMVILHAESKGDLAALTTRLHQQGVKAGLALLQDTSVESAVELIAQMDHVLIFSGSLGSFGGHVDLSLLGKVKRIRDIKPDVTIGWDGGISTENALQLSEGGIDVLNVGGAVQRANHPENAYRDICRQLMS